MSMTISQDIVLDPDQDLDKYKDNDQGHIFVFTFHIFK